MKVTVVKWIALVICGVPTLLVAITRDEVISAADSEASYSYSSCSATDTIGIMGNVYHQNYLDANECCGCTPTACILINEWPFGTDGWPLQHTWSGACYCYGGNTMGSNCQGKIDEDCGVGATSCQWSANGKNTESWAAGIDCSHFVCQCLGISYANTSNLPSVCDEINWDNLQKGDLLINPGSHVMMFKEWDGPDKSNYTVIHSSMGGVSIGANRVWEQTGRSKFVDDLNYTPYAPNCISGDPAASVVGFRAELSNGIATLSWKTECERDTRDFWVERSPSRNGPWTRISELIPGRGTDTEGAEYRINDPMYSGGMVFYRLIEREIRWREIVKRIAVLE
jgi:hypothetical protein